MARTNWWASAFLMALASATTGVASSQEPAVASSGAKVFDRDFFAAYNAVTAFDMVERVPGFSINDGDDRRGFGATAGNVLVNGERPSSKAGISEQLKRIPAGSVLRLELVSGGEGDLDVRGQTQLVNVVLDRSQREASPLSWVIGLRHIQYADRIGYTLQGTKTLALGENADLTIDLQFPNRDGRTVDIEAIRNASGEIVQVRDQYTQDSKEGVQASANLAWRPSATDTFNASMLYLPTVNSFNIGGLYDAPNGSFDGALFGQTDYEGTYAAEVGGDWEHRFSDALSIKLLGLATSTAEDQSDVFQFVGAGGALTGEQRLMRTSDGGERVGRGVMTWRAGGGHTLEFGAEGAFNFRDTTLDITFDAQNGAGALPRPLPVANARVEEVRGEAFITDIWTVSPAVTLETGFTYETSRITQTGDAQNERDLSFSKPRLVGTWQATPSDQFRLSVVRDVSQLDFADFASTVDVREASQQLGNTNLEPEKAWQARLEWDRRFGARSALNIAVFHDEIEDVGDALPLAFCDGDIFSKPLRSCLVAPTNPGDVFDAVGNIGDGARTGIEVRGTAPLDWLGIPRAELRFSGELSETSVIDPVTGEERSFRFAEDWKYNLSFRQDVPAWQLAWGVETNQKSSSYEYRLAETVKNIRDGQHINPFIETTAIEGITLRFSVRNVTSPTEGRVRTFYDPNRATGVIDETFTRKQKGGMYGTRIFTIQASGTF